MVTVYDLLKNEQVFICILCIGIILFFIYKSKDIARINMVVILVASILPSIISILPNISNGDKIKNKLLYSKIYFSGMQEDLIVVGLNNMSQSLISLKLSGKRDLKKILVESIPSSYSILYEIVHSYAITNKFDLIPQKNLDELNSFMLEKINHEKEYLQQIDSAKHLDSFIIEVMTLINNAMNGIDENISIQNREIVKHITRGDRLAYEIQGMFNERKSLIFADYQKGYFFIKKYESDYNRKISRGESL